MSTGDRIAIIAVLVTIAGIFTAIAVGTTWALVVAIVFWCAAGWMTIVAIRRHSPLKATPPVQSPASSLPPRNFVPISFTDLLQIRRTGTEVQGQQATS